jgi:hypothetical protein
VDFPVWILPIANSRVPGVTTASSGDLGRIHSQLSLSSQAIIFQKTISIVFHVYLEKTTPIIPTLSLPVGDVQSVKTVQNRFKPPHPARPNFLKSENLIYNACDFLSNIT